MTDRDQRGIFNGVLTRYMIGCTFPWFADIV